ncbi:MAG: preprotein translocase subunit SecG [Ruminococcaceae bacterium]|nr:preprotein translocase subunit SecG [Oscillospiraceae bacterium]
MEVLMIVLTVLEAIASIALIVVVLLQSGKESGLSGAISGNTDSYMNKSGMGGLDKKLASATKWIALVWIVLTFLVVLLNVGH